MKNTDVVYYKTHIWASASEKGFILGVSEHGLRELGEISYVESAQKGKKYRQGEVFCIIETVKTTQELAMPCDGTCVEDAVNGLPDNMSIEDVMNGGNGHLKELAEFDGVLDTKDAMSKEEYDKWLNQ